MLNTIYILQWDNYYDRRIHPGYSLADDGGLGYYLEYDTVSYTGINFVPNDGVNTTLILNIKEFQQGNYLLVLNELNEIISRWFIIDAVRTRAGQYQLSLRRDLITDYWNIIKQSPALIEKCNLSHDNPLIFNNEDMIVNQIKTDETPLKDNSDCPWLVAYIAKDAPAAQLSGTAKVGSDLESSAIAINDTIENWETEHSTFYGDYKAIEYRVYSKVITGEEDPAYYKINAYTGETDRKASNSNTNTKNTGIRITNAVGWAWTNPVQGALKRGLTTVGIDAVRNSVDAYAPDRHTSVETNEFLSYNGKVIRDINGKYFNVSITEVKSETKVYDIATGNLFNQLAAVVDNSTFKSWGSWHKAFTGTPNRYTFTLACTYNTYKTVLTPLINMTINYTISSSRVSTEDAPYDLLAIPYGTITANYSANESLTTNAAIGLATIQAIAKNLDAACYDIQLVPYCPIQDYLLDDKTINTTNSESLYSFITKGDEKVGIIYHVPKANFTFKLFNAIDAAKTNIERKINNDCDRWRLCSPNYSNYFEFSVEKNDGVQYFDVDCTYKPYSPYIHVNPNFNNLYGQDFNDPRGLVCGGDFSLSQVRDAWESYQLQNKNFQETFDRQIQNMEFNNKYQRLQDNIKAVVGTVQGGLSGATAGGIAAGPTGAIVGGIAGTAMAAAGGIADIHINEKLRSEALDYTQDMFGYQLGNIQAMPLTISKVSAFNQNNKVFPVIEYYTCTKTEKEAYINKIAYNGMTTMVISTIETVLGNSWEYEINDRTIKSQDYIKAQLIHTHLAGGSFQIANAISSEVYKGFYIVAEEE